MRIGYLQCAILMLSIIYNVFFSVWLHFFYKFFCYHNSIITITYYLIILLSLVNYSYRNLLLQIKLHAKNEKRSCHSMCIHERQLLLKSFLFNYYFYFFADLSRFHCDIGCSLFLSSDHTTGTYRCDLLI